jgi:hypothetical protein
MGKFLKIVGIIAIALVGLCVLGVIFGGRSNTTTITPAQQTTGGAANTNNAPAPTQKAQNSIGKVGDRVESAGVALTVLKVAKSPEAGQFLKADPGKVYVLADVTIENSGRDKEPYNPLYFKVKDSSGFEYSSSITGPDKALQSGELATGEKARGIVAFEVDEKATGLVMSYQPLVLAGGYEIIRVALD